MGTKNVYPVRFSGRPPQGSFTYQTPKGPGVPLCANYIATTDAAFRVRQVSIDRFASPRKPGNAPKPPGTLLVPTESMQKSFRHDLAWGGGPLILGMRPASCTCPALVWLADIKEG